MNKMIPMLTLLAAALGQATMAQAADSMDKQNYKAVQAQAKIDYQKAHDACKSITGNPKDVCIAEAKLARVQTEQTAEANYKNTVAARTHARKSIADATYDLDKTKCGAQTGNDKDVCIKKAKEVKVDAVSDAKADKKVVDARVDANADKQTAAYKVALERCDALAGPAKDNCVSSAKKDYNK